MTATLYRIWMRSRSPVTWQPPECFPHQKVSKLAICMPWGFLYNAYSRWLDPSTLLTSLKSPQGATHVNQTSNSTSTEVLVMHKVEQRCPNISKDTDFPYLVGQGCIFMEAELFSMCMFLRKKKRMLRQI